MGNLFVVAVNLKDWIRGRKVFTSDMIITSLGFSNLCIQALLAVSIYDYLVSGGIYSLDNISQLIFLIRMFVFSSSLWFATWLSVFCCVKVVNFKQSILVRLKLRISAMMPWLLFGSLLFSLVISLPAHWDLYKDESPINVTVNASVGSTITGIHFQSRCSCLFGIYLLGCFAAFTLFCVAALLLIASLCQHIQRMGQDESVLTTAQLQVHVSAVRMAISLLIINISFFVPAVLLLTSAVVAGTVLYVVCSTFICVSPALLPVVLILGNVRLRKAMAGLLLRIKCQHSKQMRH
ncbi:hypothetical protein FKM82_028604 [Ascaphus truei]